MKPHDQQARPLGLLAGTLSPRLRGPLDRPFFARKPAISVAAPTNVAFQRCIAPAAAATYGLDEVRVACDCGNLLDVGYDWDRTRPPDAWKHFEAKWSRRRDPLCLLGRVAVSRAACRSLRRRQVVTIGEGQTLLQPSDRRGPICRPRRRAAVPAIRGDEPFGQLQRQRHVGRVHACPHDRRQASRLRLDRQHQRIAGLVLRRHAD